MSIELFVSTDIDSFLSKAIRFGTGGYYTHAGIRDGATTFEARAQGCKVYDWKKEYERADMKTQRWTFVGLRDVAAMNALQRLRLSWQGLPYAYGQLLAYAWYCAQRKVGLKPTLAIKDLAVCSELAWEMVEEVGGKWLEHLKQFNGERNLFVPDDPCKEPGHKPGLFQWCEAAGKLGMMERVG